MLDLPRDYVAGLFDGEGSIVIRRTIPRTNKHGIRPYKYQAYANLCMREEVIVQGLSGRYGGVCAFTKAKKDTHSPTYKWEVSGKALDRFIADMDGRLIAKQAALTVVRKYQVCKKLVGNQPISDEHYELSQALHAELRLINAKGAGAVDSGAYMRMYPL